MFNCFSSICRDAFSFSANDACDAATFCSSLHIRGMLTVTYNTASIGSSLGFGKEHESVKNVTIQRIISHKNVHMEVCDKLYKRRVYLQWPRLKASTPKKMSRVCVFLVTSFFCSLNYLR